VSFVEVFIRQAHPGPGAPTYQRFEQKLEDARRYAREEHIPWDVVVDDLEGTVHQTYGGLADPTYLIGADGRVSFYNTWTHAPTLHRAIDALLQQGGRGIVEGGIDHRMHMLPAMTRGWAGLRRGLPQSFVDLETAAPGMASGIWMGYQMRPMLTPLTQRATPLPMAARVGLFAGAAILGTIALRSAQRRATSIR
jgi:hypothetical protein